MLPPRVHAVAAVGVLVLALVVGGTETGHHGVHRAGQAPASAATPARATQLEARPVSEIASRSHERVRHHAHRLAHRHRHAHRHRRHHLTPAQQARRVLQVARSLRGRPYVWGAAGPRAFDCSGFVQFVFRRALDRRLPKYTDTQYDVLRHLHHRGALRPGDLIFVGRQRQHKSHVGIYAGHGFWWDAPHTGSHVRRQRVWGWTHSYARVIRR